jgi:hypothetical protein
MEFDQQVCQAGLRQFVRPHMPSDDSFGDVGGRFTLPWVLVTEVQEGFRFRGELQVEQAADNPILRN